MEKNMGTTDKWLRITFAAIVAILYWQDYITGTVAIVLMVIAIIFLLTSLVSFCPLYKLLGMNTCKNK